MKNRFKNIASLAAMAVMAGFSACEDPDFAVPTPVTTPITLTSNIIFVNAVPGGPSLDLTVNGLKVGESVTAGNAQAAYTAVPLTATFFGGGSTTAGANTSVRAKASAGTIGGVLGSSDLIYRAGNTNTNNLVAANAARYTFFALDSVDRPKPLRTLNEANFADVTYFSSRPSFTAPSKNDPLVDTTIMLSGNTSTATVNLVKKYNGNVIPSYIEPIGLVPLGSSDPGGIRFLLLTETFLAFPGGNVTQSQLRFLNLSPNGGALFVRLNPVLGGSQVPAVAASTPYILSFPGFTPSVGSRATTSAFTLQTTAAASVPIEYYIEVATDAGFTNIVYNSNPTPFTFAVGKIYTVYVKGKKGAITAGVVTHN